MEQNQYGNIENTDTENFICNCAQLNCGYCSSFNKNRVNKLRNRLSGVLTSSNLCNVSIEISNDKRVSDGNMCLCEGTQEGCKFCVNLKRRKIMRDNQEASSTEELYDYWLRQNSIDFLQSEVHKNLLSLDQYKEELLQARDAIISHLDSIISSALQKIQSHTSIFNSLKDQLESARSCSYLDDNNWAHNLINTYTSLSTSLPAPPLELISWSIDCHSTLSSLQKLTQFTANLNPPRSIPYFRPKSNTLISYEINSCKTRSAELDSFFSFKPGAAYCEIPGQSVIYSGGDIKGGCNEVYQIDPLRGNISSLPCMYTYRSYHSIVYYDNSVYVFGGCNGNTRLNSCEKYDIHKGNWMFLPNMYEARSHFTTAVLKDVFYLGGGMGSNSLEMFEPKSFTFTKLLVSLPHYSYLTLITALDDRILILQGNKQLIYHPDEKRLKQDKTLPPSANSSWWSEMNPVRYDGEVYFFRKNSLWNLNIQSLELIEVIQL